MGQFQASLFRILFRLKFDFKHGLLPSGFHMFKPSVESTSDPIAEELVVTESVAVDPTVTEEQVSS